MKLKLKCVNQHGETTSLTHDGLTLTVVPPLRAGQPWTDEEDAKLRWRFEKGLELDDLALVHERTRGAITAELKRLGLIPSSLRPTRRMLGA